MTRRSLYFGSLFVLAVSSLTACDRSATNGAGGGQDGYVGGALVGAACSSEQLYQSYACAAPSRSGTGPATTCVPQGANYVWSPCTTPPPDECSAGQQEGGCTETCAVNPEGHTTNYLRYCEQNPATGQWQWGKCSWPSQCNTPLVFSFDDAPVRFSHAEGSFGIDPMHSVDTDWPTAATPWLARDLNGNGAIDDGGELFGSATMLSNGAYAKNGFQALAELDDNHDGLISPADRAFDSLIVWTDTDQNRVADPGELHSLRSMGIEAIELGYANTPRCDLRGNCEVETARFIYRTALGEENVGHIIDVHLASR